MKTKQILNIVIVFLIITVVSIISPLRALALTVGEITNEFACTCGCNMVVSACEGSMTCDAAKNITAEVDQLINQGKTKVEIVKYFTKKYGERILAAPTKKGFNLTAWILPFIALLLGGGLIYVFIDRCLKYSKRNVELKDAGAPIPPDEKKYLERLEKELTNFEP